MELSAVLLARVIGFIETSDLNPRGTVPFAKITELVVRRFGFSRYPQSASDYDEQKGVEFADGYLDGIVIDKLTIWTNGIGVDVRSSTDDGKRILEDSLSWLKGELGLKYEQHMIRRWAYLSQVTLYSGVNLSAHSTAIRNLCDRLSKELGHLQSSAFEFSVTGINLGFDRTVKTLPIAEFTIQRRADTPFEDRKYYSQAPLPTAIHLQLLEQFEKDMLTR